METAAFTLRRSGADDFDSCADLYEAVAAEGRWIGGELPIDRERMKHDFLARWSGVGDDGVMLLAEADDGLIGNLGIHVRRGIADIGMMVAVDWRGRGVGSALIRAALDWAGASGAHKVVLRVWPHNVAARQLYRKFGFVEEGRLRRHYRRASGELWDGIQMGLVLDTTSPGSALAEPCLPDRAGWRSRQVG